MVYKSNYPDLDIPRCNLLSFIFPTTNVPSDQPLWIDAANTKHSLSPREALLWVKRLGCGLDRHGIGKQEVVMLLTPNHHWIPVAYFGIVGSSRIFSAANPLYTVGEVEYQIKNTGTRLIMVHPDIVTTAVAAAKRAGLSKDDVFSPL